MILLVGIIRTHSSLQRPVYFANILCFCLGSDVIADLGSVRFEFLCICWTWRLGTAAKKVDGAASSEDTRGHQPSERASCGLTRHFAQVMSLSANGSARSRCQAGTKREPMGLCLQIYEEKSGSEWRVMRGGKHLCAVHLCTSETRTLEESPLRSNCMFPCGAKKYHWANKWDLNPADAVTLYSEYCA